MRVEIERVVRVTLDYRTITGRLFVAQVVGWLRRHALCYRGNALRLSVLLAEKDAGALMSLIKGAGFPVREIGTDGGIVKLAGSPVYGSRPADKRRASVSKMPTGDFYRIVRQTRNGEFRESIVGAESLTDDEILELPLSSRDVALAEIGMTATGNMVHSPPRDLPAGVADGKV